MLSQNSAVGVDSSRERIHISGQMPMSESPDRDEDNVDRESRETTNHPATAEPENERTGVSNQDAPASQTAVTDGMTSPNMKASAMDESADELNVTGSLQKDTVYMQGEGPQSMTYHHGSPSQTGAPDSHGGQQLRGDVSDIAVMTNNISVCDQAVRQR